MSDSASTVMVVMAKLMPEDAHECSVTVCPGDYPGVLRRFTLFSKPDDASGGTTLTLKRKVARQWKVRHIAGADMADTPFDTRGDAIAFAKTKRFAYVYDPDGKLVADERG